MEICVPFTEFLVFITSSMPFAVFLSGQASLGFPYFQKMADDPSQVSGCFFANKLQGYYECSACHVLAPDHENLLQRECASFKSGR